MVTVHTSSKIQEKSIYQTSEVCVWNRSTMFFEVKTEWQFDNQSIEIKRFNSYAVSSIFRDTCLPLILAHLRPLEVIFAAMINQFAPDQNWGLYHSVLFGEKEIDSV